MGAEADIGGKKRKDRASDNGKPKAKRMRVSLTKAFYGALRYETDSSDDTELPLPTRSIHRSADTPASDSLPATDPFTDPPTPPAPAPAPASADSESVTDSNSWAAVVVLLEAERNKKRKNRCRTGASFPEEDQGAAIKKEK